MASLRLAAALLLLASPAAAERSLLVVSAPPPLDGERLADALRVYLGGDDVEVRVVPATPGTDLLQALAAAQRAGEATGVVASVRVASTSGSADIVLVDRLNDKMLIASIPRRGRDPDLYRAVALKVQALLRAALSEEVSRVAERPTLARLVAPPPAPAVVVTPRPPARERHLALDAAYAMSSFPLGGLVQHGASLMGRFEIGPGELCLGVQALAPLTLTRDDVTAIVHHVPIVVSGGLRLRRPRFEGVAGAVLQVGVIALSANSPLAEVRSDVTALASLGLQLTGRVRVTPRFFFHLRASVLGVMAGARYAVRGETLVELAQLQVGLEAGLGAVLW
jgi:hypothetical protein